MPVLGTDFYLVYFWALGKELQGLPTGSAFWIKPVLIQGCERFFFQFGEFAIH
jgi:hypothetical protein